MVLDLSVLELCKVVPEEMEEWDRIGILIITRMGIMETMVVVELLADLVLEVKELTVVVGLVLIEMVERVRMGQLV